MPVSLRLFAIAFILSFLVSGKALADCSNGAICSQSCPSNMSPTGGSCTIQAAELQLPGICCASISNPNINTGNNTGTSATNGQAYQNQEKIPGFGQTSDFPTYMKQIINFLFATIGILAMFMLMIGAYQYLMAAGNIAKEENAKTTLSSAFSGLILGLIAYLLLQTINPDLVSFKLDALKGGLTGTSTGTGTGAGATPGGSPGTGSGKCTPVTSGPCSVENLKNTCFASVAEQASSICNAESKGASGVPSGVDKCQTGESFSVGLFQINLTCECKEAFNSGKPKGCANKTCTIKDRGAYDACMQKYKDPAANIQAACRIYNEGGWNRWGANTQKGGCGF